MNMFNKVLPIAFPLEIADILKAIGHSNDLEVFESQFANVFNLNYCIALSLGRSALTLALIALKETNQGKTDVIIPAYTCPTVALSVARAGLNVKLCDISIETLNIDVSIIDQLVNENTLCMIAVHSFGFPCDMDKLTEIANRKDVFLIEDVAQSAGAKWKGKTLGSIGHLSCFSLGRGKSLTTYEGGILGINNVNESIKERLKALSDPLNRPGKIHSFSVFVQLIAMLFFQRPRLWWFISKLPLGFENQYHSIDFHIQRLSNWQSALGLSVLRKLESINTIRKRNGEYLIQQLRDVKTITIPKIIDNAEPVYLRLPVVFQNKEMREEAYHKLNKVGIGVSRMYINPLHRYDYLKGIVPRGNYPVSEYVADRILTVPTHPLVTKKNLEVIANVLKNLAEG
ncbi:TPA: hypothetical protein ENX78_05745 [Candidatus Poribacteria bacterium]|nr:hypothetical protein [Candidatus Poribacteria bacterium]